MKEYLLNKLTALTNDELDKYDLLAMGNKGEGIVISDTRLTKGQSEIIVLPHTRFTPTPMHRHTYVEIMIALGGEIKHTVGADDVCLHAGDILFMNRHVMHSIEAVKRGDLAVNIIMTSSFVRALEGELSNTVFCDFLRENAKNDGAGTYLHFRVGDQCQIENLIENILFELTEYQSNTAILTRSVALLFHYLSLKSRDLLVGGNNRLDKIETRKLEILSYIKGNYRSANLAQLSARLFISPPYLSKTIKAYFGKSFKELLVEERMERARELLTETSIPIGDIIRSLGYENESYFHREFKKRMGTTPMAMRKGVKAKNLAQIHK